MAARKTIDQLRQEYEVAPMGARLAPPIVAAGLNLSAATLERWRSVGKGPRYVKIGGRVAYVKRDVEAWVTLQTEALV